MDHPEWILFKPWFKEELIFADDKDHFVARRVGRGEVKTKFKANKERYRIGHAMESWKH